MNLVINSQFRPFTYDEMVKPLMQYKEVYDKLETDYSNLLAQTEAWKNIAEREKNPIAYAMYKRYSDDLNNITADFSKGMNLNNRRALIGMKKRYAEDIAPIATAYNRKKELADEQRKVLASNPTMLYQRNASDMSLDAFIENPNADYGQQYSGALITQQVANAAANLAKEARDSEDGKRKLRKILPYQYEMAQQSGFSREAVMKAILNEPDANRILTGLVDSAINTSGVLNWGDKQTIERAYDYARQGLFNAIGQTQYQMVTDQYGMQDALNRKAEARAAARAKEHNKPEGLSMYDTGKITLSGAATTNAERANQLASIKLWQQKGWLTSKGQLTISGVKELRRQASIANYQYQYAHAKTSKERKKYLNALGKLGATTTESIMGMSGVKDGASRGTTVPSKVSRNFYDFARNVGISREAIIKAGDTNGKILAGATLMNDYVSGILNNKTDFAVKNVPRLDVYKQDILNDTSRGIVINSLTNGGDGKLKKIESINKDGSITTSKGITYKDINKDKHNVTRTAFIPSRPGAIIVKVNGEDYLMEEGAVLNALGEPSYNEFRNAVSNVAKAKTEAQRATAINNAHSMMARLGFGINYTQVERDISDGIDDISF